MGKWIHGWRGTREYQIWSGMKARCRNKKAPDYPRYGGRGIQVCERWSDFINFISDMGPCPEGKGIDRFPDNNGNYEPGNCRWATPKEQRRNMPDLVIVKTPRGEMPLVDYANSIGLTRGAAHLRLKRGKLEDCIKC